MDGQVNCNRSTTLTYVGIVMLYYVIHCTLVYIVFSSNCTVMVALVLVAQLWLRSRLVSVLFSILSGSLHCFAFFKMFFALVVNIIFNE